MNEYIVSFLVGESIGATSEHVLVNGGESIAERTISNWWKSDESP